MIAPYHLYIIKSSLMNSFARREYEVIATLHAPLRFSRIVFELQEIPAIKEWQVLSRNLPFFFS